MKKIVLAVVCLLALVLVSCNTVENTVSESEVISEEVFELSLKFNGTEVENDGYFFEDIAWEPGSMAIGTFEIVNDGVLVYNYDFNFVCEGSLADILCVAIVDKDASKSECISVFDDEENYTRLSDFIADGIIIPGESCEYTVAVYFNPDDTDRITQAECVGFKIGAQVRKSQLAAEKDSF